MNSASAAALQCQSEAPFVTAVLLQAQPLPSAEAAGGWTGSCQLLQAAHQPIRAVLTLEQAAPAGGKMLILDSPHNPL